MSLDSGHKVPGTAHGFMNQGGGQDVVFERAVEAEMQKQLAAIRQSQEQQASLQSTARPHLPPAHQTQPHLAMRHSGKRNAQRVCLSLREARVCSSTTLQSYGSFCLSDSLKALYSF